MRLGSSRSARAWDGAPFGRIGHKHDSDWLVDKLYRLPETFRKPVSERYRKAYRESRFDANTMIRETVDSVAGNSHRMAANDDDLCQWAAVRAKACRYIKMKAADDDRAYKNLFDYCEGVGIPPEEVSKKRTVIGAIARMCCERWWRRRVRKTHGRRVESAAINIGLVNNRAGLYCSDETLERRRQQRSRNRRMLESCLAVNELEQSYTLQELADLSVSNPVIRRGELMMRMAGFEQYADNQGHVGDFYTWTCPSRMHYASSKFDGTTPAEAQRYLCGQWAKARAAMRRAEVSVYGFRVAEPHHDGTPHWHMLFFMSPEDREAVRAILKRYALQVDGAEQGAKKHRFTVVPIDREKGTAAGYLAKYVAKNIDAFGVDRVDEDVTGRRDPAECARRVDAWASTWGIRQFQQCGGPSVTVWRELRRVRDEQAGPVEPARYCADKSNWFGYMKEMIQQPVRLLKCWSDKPGAYDEPVGDRVIGVACGAVMLVTRVHEWRVERGRNTRGQILLRAEANGVGNKGASVVGIQSATEGVAGRSVGVGIYGNADVPDSAGEVISEGAANGRQFDIKNIDGRWLIFEAGTVRPWSSVNNCTKGENSNESGVGKYSGSVCSGGRSCGAGGIANNGPSG